MNKTIIEKLDAKLPFVIFRWDKESKMIHYYCISEYNNFDYPEINFSEREGSIPCSKTVFDWFYDESFQTDGYLVSVRSYPKISDLLINEIPDIFMRAKLLSINGYKVELENTKSGIYIIA